MSVSLNDEVRAVSAAVTSDLDSLEQQLHHQGQERAATSDRITQAKTTLDLLHAQERTRSARLEELFNTERTLRDQLKELNSKLESVRKDREALEVAQSSDREAEDRYEQERRRLEQIDREISNLVARKLELQSRRQESLAEAFMLYLSKTADALNSAAAQAQAASTSAKARLAFDEARHSDPSVMSAAESIEELRKLLGLAQVPTVRDHLALELRKAESLVEERFPGALAQRSTTETLDIQELFWREDGEQAVIYLPARNVDVADPSALGAPLRVAFGVAKNLRLSSDSMTIGRFGEFTTIETPSIRLQEGDGPPESISVTLAGGHQVALLLTTLPTDVSDAVSRYADAV